MPEFEAFMERLSTFCRVLIFDKAGVGLSDPVPRVRTLDDRAAEIEAVMDAVGFTKAVIHGISEGGPAAIVFAATTGANAGSDPHGYGLVHRLLQRLGRHRPRPGRVEASPPTRSG
jgi:pimeloyl-ACP methyl ester carboxylesterase